LATMGPDIQSCRWLPTFRRNILPPSFISTLKMETIRYFPSILFYYLCIYTDRNFPLVKHGNLILQANITRVCSLSHPFSVMIDDLPIQKALKVLSTPPLMSRMPDLS
jgi:hypothetical protein